MRAQGTTMLLVLLCSCFSTTTAVPHPPEALQQPITAFFQPLGAVPAVQQVAQANNPAAVPVPPPVQPNPLLAAQPPNALPLPATVAALPPLQLPWFPAGQGTTSLQSYPGIANAPFEYVSGFLDGDGTITVVKEPGESNYRVRVSFYQSSAAYLAWFRQHLLGGRGSGATQLLSDQAIATLRAQGAEVGKYSGGEAVHITRIAAQSDVLWLLQALQPRLIRKSQQALLALQLLNLQATPGPQSLQQQQQLAQQISALNQRAQVPLDPLLYARFTAAYFGGLWDAEGGVTWRTVKGMNSKLYTYARTSLSQGGCIALLWFAHRWLVSRNARAKLVLSQQRSMFSNSKASNKEMYQVMVVGGNSCRKAHKLAYLRHKTRAFGSIKGARPWLGSQWRASLSQQQLNALPPFAQ